MKRVSLLSTLGAFALAACGGEPDTPDTAPLDGEPAPIPPAATAEELADMQVTLGSLDGLTVDLTDGAGTGQMGQQVTLLAAYEATGDFDSDGVTETAVLVATEPGGTGRFTHLLAARTGSDGVVEQVAEKLLGDRQQFHRFETKADSLLIELTTQAPNDPVCCPTRRAQQIYVIRDGQWRLWRDNTLSAAPPDISDGVVRRDSSVPQAGPVRSGGGGG